MLAGLDWPGVDRGRGPWISGGAEYMAKLARDAGFQQATVINTDGKPGVFAMLDAGAPKTVGLYFMYDVKQFDPAEWSSPPTEAPESWTSRRLEK